MNQYHRRKPLVLGLSASLRNARFGAGSEQLIRELKEIRSRSSLDEYLRGQAQICLKSFIEAGRAEHLPFDRIYRNLQKRRGDQGLSNSEIALAAGLWGVKNQGVDIDHLGLSQFFPPNSAPVRIEELKARLVQADGILLSGPVYFGDRGSVAHSFIEMIRKDPSLMSKLQNKLYAGISVGAKRNGGQETTLIYQMLDLLNLGLLVVGNDAGTTSQYGGTCVAGDVGTMAADEYGLNTSVGTGNRLGQVVNLFHDSERYDLKRPVKIAAWVLQDRDGFARKKLEEMLERLNSTEVRADFRIYDMTEKQVRRCIACDVCPTHVASDSEYRCIIKQSNDLFASMHTELIDADAILMVGFSPNDYANLQSVYQKFVERTRYLRRGDYVLSNLMASPLVFEELGATENLWLRMMTSLIRHNTLISRPIIAHVSNDTVLNEDVVLSNLRKFATNARYAAVGSLKAFLESQSPYTIYNPVGYVMSVEKDREAIAMKIRETAVEDRFRQRKLAAQVQLVRKEKDKAATSGSPLIHKFLDDEVGL